MLGAMGMRSIAAEMMFGVNLVICNIGRLLVNALWGIRSMQGGKGSGGP